MNVTDEVESVSSRLASYFAGQAGVQAAWLFGSHPEGRHHRDSDIDVAVLLARAGYPSARARFGSSPQGPVNPGVEGCPGGTTAETNASSSSSRRCSTARR